MNDELPAEALRLLAGLIAADIRAGSPLLDAPVASANAGPRRRGRPKSVPVAVASYCSARSEPAPSAAAPLDAA